MDHGRFFSPFTIFGSFEEETEEDKTAITSAGGQAQSSMGDLIPNLFASAYGLPTTNPSAELLNNFAQNIAGCQEAASLQGGGKNPLEYNRWPPHETSRRYFWRCLSELDRCACVGSPVVWLVKMAVSTKVPLPSVYCAKSWRREFAPVINSHRILGSFFIRGGDIGPSLRHSSDGEILTVSFPSNGGTTRGGRFAKRRALPFATLL